MPIPAVISLAFGTMGEQPYFWRKSESMYINVNVVSQAQNMFSFKQKNLVS
jgi:hypothetical protein